MSRREYFLDLGEEVLKQYDEQIESGKNPEIVSANLIAQEQKKLLQKLTLFNKKIASPKSNDNINNIKILDNYIKNLSDE